jgi:hypothetical protein
MEATVLDTVQPENRQTRRPGRTLRAAVAALAIGFAIVAPAQAYTITSRTGVPVTPTIYMVQGAHYNIGSAVTGPMMKQWVFQSGPVVYRVAGSGAQTVKVAYTVERWNGSAWIAVARPSGSVTIAATVTSAKAPNLSVLPTEGSGYYRVKLGLTWTSPIGAVLGSMNVSMSSSTDYQCSTTRTCTVGAGWVYLGA